MAHFAGQGSGADLMNTLRGVILSLALTIAIAPGTAEAQGRIKPVTECLKKVWEYFGKPVTKGAAEKVGGVAAEYFIDKIRKSGSSATISDSDVQALQQRGLSDCQIREAIMAMQEIRPVNVPPRGYSAQAHCARTGAVGTAHNMPSPQQAVDHAVYDCAYRGGIPDCCRQGVRVTP
jgi:hypothetical protein